MEPGESNTTPSCLTWWVVVQWDGGGSYCVWVEWITASELKYDYEMKMGCNHKNVTVAGG